MSIFKDDSYWLKEAVHISEHRAPHTQLDENLPKIGAVLVRGKHRIAQGVNLRKTHPIQWQFRRNDDSVFLHAEISTIVNAVRRNPDIDFKNTTMYIGRAKKFMVPRRRGEDIVHGWGLSKPCSGCMGALLHYGISRVVYTDDSIISDKWQDISF